MADAAELTPAKWQILPLEINPPGLAPLALTLIAELHGRFGYFIPELNICPVKDSLPLRYEVAEIVNVQALRDGVRTRRWETS